MKTTRTAGIDRSDNSKDKSDESNEVGEHNASDRDDGYSAEVFDVQRKHLPKARKSTTLFGKQTVRLGDQLVCTRASG